MPSPPKPWEKSSALSSSALDSSSSASPSSLSPSPSSATPPLRPPLPSTTPAYTTAGYPSVSANRYGASTYGNAYGSGSYGSAYNSGYGSSYGSGSRYGPYGTYGGGYGSGYGGTYGSGYGGYSGGYGGGYGGYNRPGGYGRPLGAPDEFSLTQAMERNTAGAFHMLDQIVGAFGGFAQMLDSTFHATHSSFMAMVGVVERFGHLRNYLGQVLSMFTLLRFCKNVLRRAIGLKPVAQTQELTAGEFSKFENQPPRPSKRPFFIFLLIVVGIPYLMRRIMKSAERRRLSQPGLLENGQPIATKDSPVLDPSQLEFARALFDFAGENPMELHLLRGDILAILSKTDAFGAPSQWWRARLKSGEQGLVPSNYLEILEKKTPPLPQANPDPTAI